MIVIWAANFSIVKIVIRDFSPMVFNGIRFAAATVIVLLVTRLTGEDWRVERRDVRRLVLLGLLGNTAYQLLFINGIARTTAGNSSLMLGTVPVYVSLIGTLTRLERLAWYGWLGCLLATGGTALIVLGSGQIVDVQSDSLLGTLLVLCAAISWAAYTVLSRPLLQQYSSLKVTGLLMLSGTPGLLLAAIPQWGAQNWAAVPWQSWLGLIYSAALALGLAYVIWNTGVKMVGGTRTAIYSNLQPVVAMLIGWLWIGETIGGVQFAGAAVIVAGVFLTRTGTLKRNDSTTT
jgi:drug/metabolite transporter (DMT)-like permease